MGDRLKTWTDKWEANDLGWQEKNVNPRLLQHVETLTQGKKPCQIYLPLCGKAPELKWFYDLGHNVVGVEGAEKGIREFFEENNLLFDVSTDESGIPCYKSKDGRMKIFKSDIFKIPIEKLGRIEAVWDRGSFVAIWKEDREEYVSHMSKLLSSGSKIFMEYIYYNEDLTEFRGAPRSVSTEELRKLFGAAFKVEDPLHVEDWANHERAKRWKVQDLWVMDTFLTRI
ncbi:unnamed protein product [Darwinula stevensoni]|uniref:thiopurine S-methyltransferase n=1 Tax=Darwinula stevensoni TaxID=69355 RepID=A0A7R8X2H3_9CRUS|nr:unnamed protein product [Darwinula stevensoni]CAG0883940.1 unnamed protein product [Darwinula stevensoni]